MRSPHPRRGRGKDREIVRTRTRSERRRLGFYRRRLQRDSGTRGANNNIFIGGSLSPAAAYPRAVTYECVAFHSRPAGGPSEDVGRRARISAVIGEATAEVQISINVLKAYYGYLS